MGTLKIQDNLFCTHIDLKKKPENIKDGGFEDFEKCHQKDRHWKRINSWQIVMVLHKNCKFFFFFFSCVFVPWKPNSGSHNLILAEKDVGDKNSRNTGTVWNFASNFSWKLKDLKISNYKLRVEEGQTMVPVHIREFGTSRSRGVNCSLSPKEEKLNIAAQREKPYSLSLFLSPSFSLISCLVLGTSSTAELYLHQQFFWTHPF